MKNRIGTLNSKRRGTSSLTEDLVSSYASAYQQKSVFYKDQLWKNTPSFLRTMPPGALEDLSLFSKMMFHRRLSDPLSPTRSDDASPYYSLSSPYNSLHRPSPSSLRHSDNPSAGTNHSSPLPSPIQPYPVRLLPSDLRWPHSLLPLPLHWTVSHHSTR